MEKLLTVEEARERLLAGLAEITGWKLLKSRSELSRQIGELVFQLNVSYSKDNRSEESVCAELDFRLWSKSYGKTGDANSIVADMSFREGSGGWFDITTEEKLEAVLARLARELRETALPLCERFAADFDAGVRSLTGEDLFKYRVWLRFIEDKLGREEAEKAARAICAQAPEPMKRQLAEYAAGGKLGGWLRMDRNAKYMAEHDLIRLP